MIHPSRQLAKKGLPLLVKRANLMALSLLY